jgi:hypothetical protein
MKEGKKAQEEGEGGRKKLGQRRTCDVQTLLNVTKTNVWTNQAKDRSLRPRSAPSNRHSPIWGRNAARGCRAKAWRPLVTVGEEEEAVR